jgi:putative membrane protein
MPGVRVAGFTTALIVAIVLGLLNVFIKTNISTTYIACYDHYFRFLLVINALMILLCTKIVGGFSVDTF